jgi:molecular chaperone DnaK (HSP70)
MERDFHDNRLPDVIHPTFEITYKQFDEIMEPFLLIPSRRATLRDRKCRHSLIVPVLETLARAKIDPAELDALILHGGSCRNPYIRTRLREVLSDRESLFSHMEVFETPDLDTSVACGAALACYWKHARGEELTAPIIAEDLGVMTLGDQPVRLVKACESLPYPDENALEENGPFYAPREGLRQLLVPFYVGSEAMRRISGTVQIDLPTGVKRGDIIKIKLQVDRDKVVHWWYNINVGEFSKAQSLENP